jgi:hypothetical protein
MDAKAVSKPVGDIATSLYAREEDHAARTATGLISHTKRSRQDGDDRSSDSSSDSSSDDSDDEGSAEEYVTRQPSRATFCLRDRPRVYRPRLVLFGSLRRSPAEPY